MGINEMLQDVFSRKQAEQAPPPQAQASADKPDINAVLAQMAQMQAQMNAMMQLVSQAQAAPPQAAPPQTDSGTLVITYDDVGGREEVDDDDGETDEMRELARQYLFRAGIKHSVKDVFGGVKPTNEEFVDYAIAHGFDRDNPGASVKASEPAKTGTERKREHGEFSKPNGDVGPIDLEALRSFVKSAPVFKGGHITRDLGPDDGVFWLYPDGQPAHNAGKFANKALSASGLAWEPNYPQRMPVVSKGGQTLNYKATVCARGNGIYKRKYGTVVPQLALSPEMEPHKRFLRTKALCIVRLPDNLPLSDVWTDYASS